MSEPGKSRGPRQPSLGQALLQSAAGRVFRMLDDWRTRRFVQRLQALPPLALDVPDGPERSFRHSGNAGDVIYALPAVRALAGDRPASLFLRLGVPHPHGQHDHPVGNVRLNRRMFDMLHPLLSMQPGIGRCEVFDGQHIDYDLDLVREYPFPLQGGHIARWYFLTFAVTADLSQPWLVAPPNPALREHVVIARSQRYRAPGIDYAFLRRYPKLAFVGLEAEFADMRKALPSLEFHPVGNFLEMASAIAGARLFIGNQSFPFALAEGLKVPRMLEVSHLWPNVIVEGARAYDFCYQPQFEKLVERFMA